MPQKNRLKVFYKPLKNSTPELETRTKNSNSKQKNKIF